MFPWLQSIDSGVFHFVNSSLINSVFDLLMPLLSDVPFFNFGVLLLALVLLIRGNTRMRVFVLFLLLAVALGDTLICGPLKHAFARPRPFETLADVHVLVGKGGAGSMPSSHAANWFAATAVCFIFFRRSLRFMLPLALGVCFSRVYNGVHYPSDVLVGAVLGAGYAAVFVFSANALWNRCGRSWFPLWWQKFPSLFGPTPSASTPSDSGTQGDIDTHWLRLAYVLIFVSLAARLGYLLAGRIELSEDEAYQWLWSKHPALSYYSKPPLIAWVQWLGTHLWGDNAFGVRFFSPVTAAVLSLLLVRFLAREIHVRFAFWILLITCATPMLAVGATLMTIDPLSVLFWTGAMICGWRALAANGKAGDWILCGLCMGLGVLSKYTNLAQWLSFALLFLLWPAARMQLRKPGPWLAWFISGIFLLPVILWNAQHNWITLEHVASDGHLAESWLPTLRFLQDFLAAELVLLNPIFFIGSIWAAFAFWKTQRQNPQALLLFCMSAPLFLGYFLFSFRSRVMPNWIAPSVLPLFCLGLLYWNNRAPEGCRALRRTVAVGVGFGLVFVILLHDTRLVTKIVHRTLPAKLDPLHRVHGWSATALEVGKERDRLAAEGRPAFIIGDHYGITSLISFYLPEARAAVTAQQPLVYFRTSVHPENQFFFWPGYEMRHGENAIFVSQLDHPDFVSGWFGKWIRGEGEIYSTEKIARKKIPVELERQFTSVTDLGVREIRYREQIVRRIQLFECRGLR
jgi:4-amino-4-deoxy-L-arabinose transferase-like glycosyltransferase/membrane-associated phospholipid phosphatase